MFKKLLSQKSITLFMIITLVCCMANGCAGSDKILNAKKTPLEIKHNVGQEPDTSRNEPAKPNNQPKENNIVYSPKTANKDIKVKALYLTGWTVGNKSKRDDFIELAKTTEINSFVVDIKDDDGMVGYESNIPTVREAGTWKEKYNAEQVLKEFHENNIHVIGRIVCFKDPAYSIKKPELAVKHINGGLWKENKKSEEITWLNPDKRETWPYLVAIAKEAADKGFDEIQFDYVRFPNGDRSKMDFGRKDLVKYEVINEFLAYARKELPEVILSADVFGIICESPGDREDIGQYFEMIGKKLDYISPMAYPSLYAQGQIVNSIAFPKPDLDPYGVVYNTLLKAKDRISKTEGYNANVRPYLQGYTANWLPQGYFQSYGAAQYRQQIQAVYSAGYEEWIFWDANNRYIGTSAFEKVK